MQPARGLIVDDMGRPLVANRTSWVVSVDRTMLDKLASTEAGEKRLHGSPDSATPYAGSGRPPALRRRGQQSPALLERLALPAGADRRGHPPADRALRILEQAEDFPAVIVEQQSVRAYPRRSASTPRTCSATSARSPSGELDAGREGRRRPRSTAPRSSAGPGWRRSTTSGCAGMPGYKHGRGRLDGPGARRHGRGRRPARRHPRHLASTPRCRRSSSSSSPRRSGPPAATYDTVTGRNYVADSGAVVVLDADNGRVVAMASQPTYDPDGVGRRHQPRSS